MRGVSLDSFVCLFVCARAARLDGFTSEVQQMVVAERVHKDMVSAAMMQSEARYDGRGRGRALSVWGKCAIHVLFPT